MNLAEFIDTANTWGAQRRAFFFLTDFELQQPVALLLDEVDPAHILYDVEGFTNRKTRRVNQHTPRILEKIPVAFDDYLVRFGNVYRHLHKGDTYLANLTTRTEITLDLDLVDLFYLSKARYKLCLRDQFLVFSPESFVKIEGATISSFPMKGTIDASVPDAANKIINDEKELAEHVTIVDLIRNDLSLVASKVTVTRFRYIEELRTNSRNLLQVSSEITGVLPEDYHKQLGDLLVKLLPAGSVSGAPKKKTVEILRETEKENRGYYTGVFGYFDGHRLNSGVMIRFIEKSGEKYFYRSGGGITAQSTAQSEYLETINKVYVPVD